MAGMQFTDIRIRPREVFDLTSLTVDEFQQLVSLFETAFQAHMAQWLFEREPLPAIW